MLTALLENGWTRAAGFGRRSRTDYAHARNGRRGNVEGKQNDEQQQDGDRLRR
jgi:hypothetical protein